MENLEAIAEAHGVTLSEPIGNCRRVKLNGKPLGILLHLPDGQWCGMHKNDRTPGERGDFQSVLKTLKGGAK